MRTKPYTSIGIKRLKCCRCGKPASAQWDVCADKNQYRPICQECDIALNRLVIEFLRLPNIDKIIKWYEKAYDVPYKIILFKVDERR